LPAAWLNYNKYAVVTEGFCFLLLQVQVKKKSLK